MIWGIDPDTASALVDGIAERWYHDVTERRTVRHARRPLRHGYDGDVTHRH